MERVVRPKCERCLAEDCPYADMEAEENPSHYSDIERIHQALTRIDCTLNVIAVNLATLVDRD